MDILDNVRSQVENKKNSWKKSLEKNSAMIIKDMRDDYFESQMVMQDNRDQLKKEIEKATQEIDQEFQHKFSPKVTAFLWLEFIEGNNKHLNHVLNVVGYSYPDQHKLDTIGRDWNGVNHLRKFLNDRVYLREINTYKAAIQIIEGFDLKELEYDKNLDAEDIEAMALFMELPEFAGRFAEEDKKNRKQDAEKLEEKIDAWVAEREKKSKEMIDRAERNREKAIEMFEEGLRRLADRRGVPETEVAEVMEKYHEVKDDWEVSQPFSYEMFKNLVGDKY